MKSVLLQAVGSIMFDFVVILALLYIFIVLVFSPTTSFNTDNQMCTRVKCIYYIRYEL